ncbi:ATP-binding protein [Sulfurimonas sp. HSL-1716]|uniref:sensor histidine kinase n=1 Tax=Hydrocurvibacter sulfurireducens TaxID=3131937 RepID=UPI0031F73FA4
MKTKLKRKLLLWFGGVSAFILLLFSIFFYYFLSNSINDNIKTKLEHQAADIEKALISREFPHTAFAVLDKDRTLIYKTADFTIADINEYIKKDQNFFILDNEESLENIDALYVYKGKKNFIMVYKKNIDNKVEDIVSTLVVLNPILFFSILFMASKMIDKILIPINNLIKAAKDISVNNFSTTIPRPDEDDEIKELVDSFNAMIKRLKEGVDSLDRFNSDVSHELKTPLTVILGEIDVTLRKTRESREYEKSMSTIRQEAKQMQKIVESLLLLTRYTKENIQASFEVCRLDEMLLAVIDKYSLQLQAKNIRLHKKIENVSMSANLLLLNLIFSNLLDNAVKYSEDDTDIYISLQDKKGEGILFEIIDEGIGIDGADIAKITERFYRVDKSRNKKTEGFGLGLSLVKYSVDLHNAKMSIKSSMGKGTDIKIVF